MTKQGPRHPERRLAAVLLVEQEGMNFAEAARAVGVGREIVRRWWDVYQEGGKAALLERRKTGPVPRLSDDDLRGLVNSALASEGHLSLATMLALARSELGSDISRSALKRQLVAAGLWP